MRTGSRASLIVVLALAQAACATAPGKPPSASAPTSAASAPSVPAGVPAAPVPPDPERWTGVVAEPVTEELATSLGLSRVEGLYVRQVESGSPAERAGIRTGDVLLLAGGTYVDSPGRLARVLAGVAIGSSVEVAVRRGGELLTVGLPAEPSPGGRLLVVIEPPGPGLSDLAASWGSEGAVLYAYGRVPGTQELGIVPLQVPGGPLPPIAPRPVASPGAERVIAADPERIYLGWAGSELYIDVYELATGRVGRIAVRGAESLANRCRPRGLARVGGEIWMACLRPDGPAVARIDLATGQARVDALPATYWGGLAFDGGAVLWLCCVTGGRAALARTDLATGESKVFPLPGPAVSVAAEPRAVYFLDANAIYQVKPWR